MIRVLLADDHELVRDTFASFLRAEGDFEVFEAASVEDVCNALSEGSTYDLVLLDYQMPGMEGLQGLSRVLGASDGQHVALISGVANQETARKAIDAGAIGFVPKTMAAKSVSNAVRFMALGEKYLPMSFFEEVETPPSHPVASKLTERELQVLSGLCKGLSNKEIALELDLREVTIKLHVKTLCRKLDAKNRTHAAMIAKEAALF